MFSTTAGCSHISVCIAGQTSTGARVASRTLRQQVGRQPGGVGADQPGRRRGDDHEVGLLTEPGVRDRVGAVPQVGLHRLAGQRAERRAAEEALGALRHHRDDVGAGVDEAAADLDGLVGGDPPGHAEDDARAVQHRSGQDSADVVVGLAVVGLAVLDVGRRARRAGRPT